jgi:hypothetical protein
MSRAVGTSGGGGIWLASAGIGVGCKKDDDIANPTQTTKGAPS